LDPPIPRPAVVLGPLVNPSRVPEAQEPVAATAFGPLVYPLRVPKAQGSAAESRVSVTNGVSGSVARPQRWADADADGELEMSPEQVQQLLVSVWILPHRQCDRDSFTKVECGPDSNEVQEPIDRILEQGLVIGRCKRGRGGLSVRIRAARAPRGGVHNTEPCRSTPCLIASACIVNPLE
jgi:hypothetical protein